MRPRVAAPALVALLGLFPVAVPAGIETTVHNLSAAGPGTVRAATQSEVCVFCHIPHRASTTAPLWNRPSSSAAYQPYGSSTTQAAPGQPTGASILCLSCHDGTVALGAVLSRSHPIAMAPGATTMPPGPGLLGTDLGDDHPISFAYTAALAASRGELQDPSTLLGAVRLDADGQLQCTSCHEPHDDTFPPFLVASNEDSALCRTCHRPDGWEASAHALTAAPLSAATEDRWRHAHASTVAEAACLGCHKTHTAAGAERLLLRAEEEDNCLICHDGSVAAEDVAADFRKPSRHPVDATFGVHDPAEAAVVATRHVECADCHAPHATRGGSGVDGPLAGARGVTIGGAEADPASEAYQVCLRCHGDSPGQPAPRVNRQLASTNLRLQLDPANPSFHPVVAVTGRAVPSTLPAWVGARVDCTDCHGSDRGPAAGGTGAAGVHGSNNPSLLGLPYSVADYTVEGSAAYALCYRCHDRTSILANDSFPSHQSHVVLYQTPCSACHAAHGVDGSATHNPWLINFDRDIVSPNAAGQLQFESLTPGTGSCELLCHGSDHDPKGY